MIPDPTSPIGRLLRGPVRPGVLEWIGLRPARHAAIQVVAAALLDPEFGVDGDHYAGRPGGTRQVSLIGRENLAAIASYLGRDALGPELLRRNLVVSGINLLALKGARFQIGAVTLDMTGECHPCSRIETLLGPGGYNAVRGAGGILARVVAGGTVRIGDAIGRLDPAVT
ncbi:MAG: MOSC domain-containing protein [Acetobacteraceae bacterium]